MSLPELRFRRFVDMFANYPSLQHRLTLNDSQATNGMQSLTLVYSLTNHGDRCQLDQWPHPSPIERRQPDHILQPQTLAF